MYVAEPDWSEPEEGDPPPCFRQGDLVRLRWVRPEIVVADQGDTLRVSAFEFREEVVALVSACCDLVIRPEKRKGFLLCPLREVPKSARRSADNLAALKSSAAEAKAKQLRVPFNLFYYAQTNNIGEGVIYLESIVSHGYDLLRRATKLAELTEAARIELQERIKAHFARKEPGVESPPGGD
jgi:hypothetical protein